MVAFVVVAVPFMESLFAYIFPPQLLVICAALVPTSLIAGLPAAEIVPELVMVRFAAFSALIALFLATPNLYPAESVAPELITMVAPDVSAALLKTVIAFCPCLLYVIPLFTSNVKLLWLNFCPG